MKMIFTVALCLGVALLFIGCGGAATNNATTNTATTKNTSTTTANTSTAANTSGSTTTASNAASSDSAKVSSDSAEPGTGVPECDEYIKKYEACLTKIAKSAPQVEGPMKTAFEQQRSAFKTAAATAAGKATLSGTCKQAIDTAKTATKAYACDW
jgi:hypothetical protein